MTETAMLFLHALTSLHPGSGTALGVVDLPVQRERHTGWPTIPGTSIKGVIRAEALGREEDWKKPGDAFFAVFGPKTEKAADHAGAIAFTDARILAFPVRSLQGVFAWVTCPAVLARFSRDRKLAGDTSTTGSELKVNGNLALICKGSPLAMRDGKRMVLEEFDFNTDELADGIAEWIAAKVVSDTATQDRIKTHFAVISDDLFSHLAQHATEVTARIKLDYETKTVSDRALFYEEFLPPETLFYSLLIAQPARRADTNMNATAVVDWLIALDLKTIQIGGGETIGKGLSAIRFARAAELRL